MPKHDILKYVSPLHYVRNTIASVVLHGSGMTQTGQDRHLHIGHNQDMGFTLNDREGFCGVYYKHNQNNHNIDKYPLSLSDQHLDFKLL